MSKELGELVVRECTAENFRDCDIVFSGLDSDVAGDVGMFPQSSYLNHYLLTMCRDGVHQGGYPSLL